MSTDITSITFNDGDLKTQEPTADNHVANKKYVDDVGNTKVANADIVDGLSSNDATKVLSAKQGKVLNDNKADKTELTGVLKSTDIVDNLNSVDSAKVLSAKQGKILNDHVSALSGSLVFKGQIDATGPASQLTNAKVGWFWLVNTAGTLLGKKLQVGDEVYCIADVTGTPTNFNSFDAIPAQHGILRIESGQVDFLNSLAKNVQFGNIHYSNQSAITAVSNSDSHASNIFRAYFGDFSLSPQSFALKARGTQSTPAAVKNNDFLKADYIMGYGAANIHISGEMLWKAAEDWTDASNGTIYQINKTKTGHSSTDLALEIDGDNNTQIKENLVVDGNAQIKDSVSITSPSGSNPLIISRSDWPHSFIDWKYRVRLSIISHDAISDCQVGLSINTQELISASKMKADGSDIRITAADGTTIIPHHVDAGLNTNFTSIFIKTNVPDGTVNVYLYYGNPAAASTDNPDAVFDFYDDFPGSSIDTSKWIVDNNAGLSVSGGALKFTNNSARVRSHWSFDGTLSVVETCWSLSSYFYTNGQPSGIVTLGLWTSTSNGLTFVNFDASQDAYRLQSTNTVIASVAPKGVRYIGSIATVSPSTSSLLIHNADTGASVYSNNSISRTAATTDKILLGNGSGTGGVSGAGQIDWVRVRKYIHHPIISSEGNEESSILLSVDDSGKALFSNQIQISGGSPSDGYVLVSSSNGSGSWKDPSLLSGIVKTADIVDNLNSNDPDKPLSAKQGKALSDNKVSISDVVNDLNSSATHVPLSANQGKVLQDNKAEKSDVMVRTHFKSARGSASRYLYVGELTGFFAQDNTIAVFDVYGQGDYDPDKIQQAHYTLIVRKSGQYTNRLFIDYQLVKSSTDPWTLSEATAYFKSDGTIKIYLGVTVATSYNAAMITSAINSATFTPAMTFSGSFTAPSGFTKHTTNSDIWVPAR